MSDAHTFTGVCVHRRDHVYVPAVADELVEENEDHALVFRWFGGQWAHRPLSFAVGSVCQVDNPLPLVINMGIDGQIDLFTNPGGPGQAAESIDTTVEGPSDLLHLKCIRPIGARVYVAGLARRVYRREGVGLWTAIDAGVFVPRAQRTRGVGFNAIDGFSEDTIYAVGYGGEVWRYDGQVWHQQDSPTNVALTCVRCIDPKTVYAAGLAGVVLRTVDGSWESLEHDATEDDFWGMTVFQGRVYLAAYAGLFVIDGNDVVPVDMNLPLTLSTAYLDANDGVMWSVGQKDLAYTEDGATWTGVAGPN
jgi:hypothetical protein